MKKGVLIILGILILIGLAGKVNAAECNDGIDNDGDGLIDWLVDIGCMNISDNERGGTLIDGWTVFTPTPYDSSIPLRNLSQPGSRIFYLSSEGDDITGEIYFWNGSNIVDSSLNGADEFGIAYGTDPMNPTGNIKTFRNWIYVAPKGYSNDPVQRCGDIGPGGFPGEYRTCTRYNYPDWWLFKRGDIFDINVSLVASGGKSESEVQIIGAYGDLSLPRPKIASNLSIDFIQRWGDPDPRNIMYQSLHFDGRSNSSRSVSWMYQTNLSRNILFEDVWFEAGGVTIQDTGSEIIFRKCVFTDNFRTDGGHNQGIFYSGKTDAILRIEECILMRNGFSRGDPEATGWPPSLANGQYYDIYNRNMYISGESQNMKSGLFDSISLISASGDQFRGGMRVENNFFYQGYVSLAGYGGYPDSYGPTGSFKNNVVQRFVGTGTSDNRGQPDWGVMLSSGTYGVEVSGNIVTGAQHSTNNGAFILSGRVGWPCATLLFHYPTRENKVFNNIFDATPSPYGIKIEDGIELADLVDCSLWQYPGLINNTIYNNTIVNANGVEYSYVPMYGAEGTTQDTTFEGNKVYFSREEAGVAMGWLGHNRTLKTYLQSLGISVNTDDGFLEFFYLARQQRRGNWQYDYTSQAINDYIREGFEIVSEETPPQENCTITKAYWRVI
ncbi:hypothetical protein J4402_01745 [Candidatus Pacearchaeota archaeon]|nr:hypothetical protein [Candidatus Pacearchaeota archaeon]